jgi:ribosome maturation factor RimP
MIEQSEIQQAVQNIISQKPIADKRPFIVNVSVSSSNSINIVVDAFDGINIDDCTLITKAIKQQFDQDTVNYDLTVSSAGLTESFKVREQYEKVVGKEIKVQTKEGKRFKGILNQMDEQGISLEIHAKKKNTHSTENIAFNQIKSAKQIISF